MRQILFFPLAVLLAGGCLGSSAYAAAPDAGQSAMTCPDIASPAIDCHPYAVSPRLAVRPSDSHRITYFFSYTCAPCLDVSDYLNAWSARNNVAVHRIHAVWEGDDIREGARAYYAFKEIGIVQTVGDSLAAAVEAKRYRLGGADRLAAFAEAHGVRGDLVRQALASKQNAEALAQAEQAVRAYRVHRVPFIAVDDRYALTVHLTSPHGLAELGGVLDALMARPRSDR